MLYLAQTDGVAVPATSRKSRLDSPNPAARMNFNS